jgi:peptidoglycan/LPS O-acetylase OafA/YrhL
VSDSHGGKRIQWLDGLRGLAVLMVFAYHAYLVGYWIPYFTVYGRPVSFEVLPATGFVGVELFFFISGFALYYPYARSAFEGGTPGDLATFAWRRFIKIVPSYALVVVALALAGGVAFPSAYAMLWTIFVHLSFVLNDLDRHPFGDVNAVLWSLSVEVQFYLVFPLLARAMRRYPEVTWLACCAVAIGYRALALVQVGHHAVWSAQVPAYLDLFATGMFAAYLCERSRARLAPSRRLEEAGTFAALAGFALLGVLLESLWESRWHYNWREVWALGGRSALALSFGLIALGSTFSAPWWKRVLGNPVLLFLALISYNLYLWHHFVFIMLYRAIGNNVTPMAFVAIAIPTALAIATVLTYAVELPLLRLPPPWEREKERLPNMAAAVDGPRD